MLKSVLPKTDVVKRIFCFAALMLMLTIPAWSGTLYDVWMQKQTHGSWTDPKGEYEEPEEEEPTINTSDLNKGVYILSLSRNGVVIGSTKFVK